MLQLPSVKHHRHSLVFSIALVVGDVLAILGAYSLAYIFRVKLSDAPVAEFVAAWPYFVSLLLLIPFIVLFFSLIGSYGTHGSQTKAIQMTRILVGAVGAMLFLVALDYFWLETIFPAKLIPLYALGLSILFLALARGSLYAVRWLWWQRGGSLQSVVVVGDSPAAGEIATSIARPGSGYRLRGVVGDGRLKFTTHRTLAEATRRTHPDIIIQVATAEQPTISTDLLRYAQEHYAEFKFVPSDVNDLPDRVELELFMRDIPLLAVQPTALAGWGRVAKRGFDVLAASLALLVLSPVFLVISIANMLVFGKVFFKHARLTRGNQVFGLYKFQTVRSDLNGLTPEEAFRKIGRPELIAPYRANGDFLEDDPRYGAWSRFLRSSSLDELPQFWNVVRGDISLVGPRALIPEELEGYGQKHVILNVKAGITGLAQISGRRNLPWEQRRKLDIYYVQNWSFALDIQILLSTAWQVLTGRGAH